ncbi:MAG: hypothetical protein EOQ61_11510 [Mesorhizobium sp.]|nr:hypothetical protein EOA49_25950 [Mesorhizobium sp. M1A.F.Ca.IN.020.04.1.1]RUW08953.1 hypothetical protein EOA53_17720 [Mesorhizobium sp. M1A.F.Ca.IN.020.03.1.1]RWG32141.1 MAG: hypothetical protein EOQ61_11510 [Mesorhizobium sp.]
MNGSQRREHFTCSNCSDDAIHHSPFTIHHSPFTIHHSPFTIHRSPFVFCSAKGLVPSLR